MILARIGVWGLGFGVWGLGFVVCGLWFVVSGLWFVVCGLGFEIDDQRLHLDTRINMTGRGRTGQTAASPFVRARTRPVELFGGKVLHILRRGRGREALQLRR